MKIYRVVVKEDIIDERLYKPFEAGEILLNESDYEWLYQNYPDKMVNIPMSEKEWLVYLSSEVRKSYRKLEQLNSINEELDLNARMPAAIENRTGSLCAASLYGNQLNPDYYGLGMDDIYAKSFTYINDINEYEKVVLAKAGSKNKKR